MNAELRERLEAAVEAMQVGDDATVKARMASNPIVATVEYENAIRLFRIGMKQVEGVLADWPGESER